MPLCSHKRSDSRSEKRSNIRNEKRSNTRSDERSNTCSDACSNVSSNLPAIAVGTTATLAAVGLARLAYTPLLPAVIHQGWFLSSQAVYLGAANLLGYLLGALLAFRLSEIVDTRKLLGMSFAAITLSFLLCALPAAFSWFFIWRFISGVAGGLLMVIGPAVALTAIAPERRASVASFVFTGIGMGAILSASLIPMLLRVNLSAAWLVLGLLSLLTGVIADWGLRSLAKNKASVPDTHTQAAASSDASLTVAPALSVAALLVVLAYGLDAIGFVPHTVFWVDFLEREQGLGTAAASFQWLLFGIGATIGPLLAGYVGKRYGWHRSLALGFFIKAAAIAIPLLSITLFWRSASSLIVGVMVTGLVTLTSGRVMELVGPAAYKKVWGIGAVSFSSAQALSGYGMSALYGVFGSYLPLFALGSAVMASGCLLLMLTPRAAEAPEAPAAPTHSYKKEN